MKIALFVILLIILSILVFGSGHPSSSIDPKAVTKNKYPNRFDLAHFPVNISDKEYQIDFSQFPLSPGELFPLMK